MLHTTTHKRNTPLSHGHKNESYSFSSSLVSSGPREHNPTLPQDPEADTADRKDQLTTAQDLYQWNTTVRQKPRFVRRHPAFGHFLSYCMSLLYLRIQQKRFSHPQNISQIDVA